MNAGTQYIYENEIIYHIISYFNTYKPHPSSKKMFSKLCVELTYNFY